jgi:hypothetical protein
VAGRSRWFGGEFLDEREYVVWHLAGLLDKLVVPVLVELILRGTDSRCCRVVIGIQEVEIFADLESRDKV